MHRIDNSSAATALPTPKPAGPPGFFVVGNIAVGQIATIVEADWLNTVQEELTYIVLRGGLTPDKTDNTQVLRALSRLFTGAWQIVRVTQDILVPEWATQIVFELVAGGGGGAHANSDGTNYLSGAGGGAGGYIDGQRNVVPGQVVRAIIGTGGTSDQPGGSSSLSFLDEWAVTCTGGAPGVYDHPSNSPGGPGGSAYGEPTDILVSSTWGGDGMAAGIFASTGYGGPGYWGGGGRSGNGGGAPGGGPGSGGGGAYDNTPPPHQGYVYGGRGGDGLLRYRFLP